MMTRLTVNKLRQKYFEQKKNKGPGTCGEGLYIVRGVSLFTEGVEILGHVAKQRVFWQPDGSGGGIPAKSKLFEPNWNTFSKFYFQNLEYCPLS